MPINHREAKRHPKPTTHEPGTTRTHALRRASTPEPVTHEPENHQNPRTISCPCRSFIELSSSRAGEKIDAASGISLPDYLSFLGIPGFAAWVGIEVLGDPKPGSNMFISTASGGVGMVAGQLAKLRGCKVIGSTGSDEKVLFGPCIHMILGDILSQKHFVRMNKKFGGGRQPTGTPSLAWSCVVIIFSLLADASVVHNIYKPNLASFHGLPFSSF